MGKVYQIINIQFNCHYLLAVFSDQKSVTMLSAVTPTQEVLRSGQTVAAMIPITLIETYKVRFNADNSV